MACFLQINPLIYLCTPYVEFVLENRTRVGPPFHCIAELTKLRGTHDVRFAIIFHKTTESPVSLVSTYNRLHFLSYVTGFSIDPPRVEVSVPRGLLHTQADGSTLLGACWWGGSLLGRRHLSRELSRSVLMEAVAGEQTRNSLRGSPRTSLLTLLPSFTAEGDLKTHQQQVK